MSAALLNVAQHGRRMVRVGAPAAGRCCWGRLLRARQEAALRSLPPMPAAPRHPKIEVHMLSDHRQADMGMWASWSLLRFMPEARLCVHSDGALTETDCSRWACLLPGTRFVSRGEAEARCERLLRPRFLLLHEWRKVHVLALKLVDAHLLAEAERVLIMDTDVLCFRPPTALQQAMANGDSAAWIRDMHHAYIALLKVLEQVLGVSVPLGVNTGLWTAPRAKSQDFETMSWVLERWRGDERCDWSHMWAEQTMVACWFACGLDAQPLPMTYAVTPGRLSLEQVVRHYVGSRAIRPRFFTEGVPRLQQAIRQGEIIRAMAA